MKKLMIFLMAVGLTIPNLSAKAKFDINTPKIVFATRSTAPGKKMVRVVACGRNVDKAINQAMMDAVASIIFTGVNGEHDMETIAPVLTDGLQTYAKNKHFFDEFFKKGTYSNYVVQANSTYPSGTDNIKTSKGRKVQIILIVDWKGLATYFQLNGYKTTISGLNNFN